MQHSFRKRFFHTILTGFLLAVPKCPILAGEFYMGVRTWQAEWSPGIIHSYSKQADMRNFFDYLQKRNSITIIGNATESVGGLYGGPVLSYITDDKKLSFSLVTLTGRSGLQNLSQITTNSISSTGTNPSMYVVYTDNFKSQPVRNDLDFSAGYQVLQRVKVFAGYKFQNYTYEMDHSSQGTVTGINSSTFFNFSTVGFGSRTLFSRYGGPAAGLAYGIPLSDTGSLTFSLGFYKAQGVASNEENLFVTNGSNSPGLNLLSISRNESIILMKGVTAEITYTTRVIESVLLQFGLRGQYSALIIHKTGNKELNYDNGSTQASYRPIPENKYYDRFQGLTFGVLYKL